MKSFFQRINTTAVAVGSGIVVLLLVLYTVNHPIPEHAEKAFGPDLRVVENRLCDGGPVQRYMKPKSKTDIGYEKILCINGSSAKIIMLNPTTYAGAVQDR